ncbi:polysaccharide lyase [Actinomycetospora cinnamomea]|uniref:Polysaccharide lyase-like protein n=1 Tax=Actinomycetospora cinnamomea TaxID=663609 RepID=A0A2U1F733_9PSEU|nr:polysaccharide lyase [Actinomycetospora cinnamomea]PVZ07991.1 polysaccharide lyase-like protein [Actinomycetospora cinnamomea]
MLTPVLAHSRRRAATLFAAVTTCAVLTSGQAAGAEGHGTRGGPSAAPVPVGSRVVFTGDYETGDFGQWQVCQSAVRNSSCDGVGQGDRAMQILPEEKARQGRHAARFVIRPGDVPDFGGGERSEVQSSAEGAVVREGDERWYEWSMRFPENWENPTGGWFIVLQWHSSKGSPPLAIDINRRSEIYIGGDGVPHETKTIGRVRPGEWVDYVLHVKFSKSAETGFVEAWENGRQTVSRTSRATMNDGRNYLKQGIYRDEGPATELWHDGLRVTAP